MVKLKKFVEGSVMEGGIDPDDIIGSDDWVLSWTPDEKREGTGFTLFTPKTFNPEEEGGPMGGLVLAAVYFILEHGDSNFPRELISRANELSKELNEREKRGSSMKNPPGRILN